MEKNLLKVIHHLHFKNGLNYILNKIHLLKNIMKDIMKIIMKNIIKMF